MTTEAGLPISLNGRSYLIDTSERSDAIFRHDTIPTVNQRISTTGTVGERTLNPEGLWRAAQDSWHLGAGQKVADADDSSPYRFRDSSGIDPWERGRLKLQPDVSLELAGTSTANVYIEDNFIVQGTTLWRFSEFVEGGTAPDTFASAWTGAAIDAAKHGDDCYIVKAAAGVEKFTNSTDGFASFSAQVVTGIADAHGRLVGWSGATLYDFTADAAGGTSVTVQGGSSIVDVAEGDGLIYVATESAVYSAAVNESTGGISTPTKAGAVPDGETIQTIITYLGFVLIGTSTGVRLAQPDSTGDLTIGASFGPDTSITHLRPLGQFVWGAALGHIIRIDLANFTDTLTPAWANDLVVPTGNVMNIGVQYGNIVPRAPRPYYWEQGVGLQVAAASTKVSSGTLDTGEFTYGIVDDKTVHLTTLRGKTPLGGSTFAASYALRDGSDDLSTPTASATNFVSDVPEVQITLTGGELTSIIATATPDTDLGMFIVLPLILYPLLEWDNGVEVAQDPIAERDHIHTLWQNRTPVAYVEGGLTATVIVEDYSWRPVLPSQSPDGADIDAWSGTMVVKLKEVSRG